MSKIEVSPTSLKRFPKYRAISQALAGLGWEYITSADLARACDMQEVLVRKDLAQTGVVGRPHNGYRIDALVSSVNRVLGWDVPRSIFIVGAGWLASSVTAYPVFAECNLKFAFAVDTDPEKIGKEMNGVPVISEAEAEVRLKAEPIRLALLTVPVPVAQAVADRLVSLGVKAILNFTPAAISTPQDVKVVDANLSPFLAELCFSLRSQEQSSGLPNA